jgi:hypothetical protein
MSVQFVMDGKVMSPAECEKAFVAKMSPEEKADLLEGVKKRYVSKLKSVSTSSGAK